MKEELRTCRVASVAHTACTLYEIVLTTSNRFDAGIILRELQRLQLAALCLFLACMVLPLHVAVCVTGHLLEKWPCESVVRPPGCPFGRLGVPRCVGDPTGTYALVCIYFRGNFVRPLFVIAPPR